MPTNVAAFNAAFAKKARGLPEKKLLLFHRSIHMRLLRGIVFKTPVDTGRLRANWQTAVGTSVSVVQPEGRGVGRRKGGKTGGGVRSAINPAVFGVALKVLSGLKPFSKSFIFNNVKYAKFVEEGTPKAKGHHMVQRTLSEITGVLS